MLTAAARAIDHRRERGDALRRGGLHLCRFLDLLLGREVGLKICFRVRQARIVLQRHFVEIDRGEMVAGLLRVPRHHVEREADIGAVGVGGWPKLQRLAKEVGRLRVIAGLVCVPAAGVERDRLNRIECALQILAVERRGVVADRAAIVVDRRLPIAPRLGLCALVVECHGEILPEGIVVRLDVHCLAEIVRRRRVVLVCIGGTALLVEIARLPRCCGFSRFFAAFGWIVAVTATAAAVVNGASSSIQSTILILSPPLGVKGLIEAIGTASRVPIRTRIKVVRLMTPPAHLAVIVGSSRGLACRTRAVAD